MAARVTVAEAVGRALAEAGVRTVFGVVGSGNFHVTNALTAHGARFIAARHEGGAAVMADAYARLSGELAVVSVHQGPGLTNALTGITEAAKSRTPMLVLAPEATDPRSNFHIDQAALTTSVFASTKRLRDPAATQDTLEGAVRVAVAERRVVVLGLPLDVQAAQTVPFTLRLPFELRLPFRLTVSPGPVSAEGLLAKAMLADAVPPPAVLATMVPTQAVLASAVSADDVAALAGLLRAARRPVFIAGRGARHAGRQLAALAESTGALLATSAVARGLFRGDPFSLDLSGGFATPVAAELIAGADLLVGWGCALNMWTLRHGTLVGRDPSTGRKATVVQVDIDPGALGAHTPIDLGVVGDVAAVATAVHDNSKTWTGASGYRTSQVADRIKREGRWRDVPFEPWAEPGRIDPRVLSIALDDMLPPERTIATDSGNFMGYPSMFLDVPDEHGLVFTQAFQSVGLGLATAIGAAIARPDRLTVAALGDGGALMGISELETAVRLGLGLLVVVYDDDAYGAEVHHFGPHGQPLDHVLFPETDIAAIARGFGCAGITVRTADDLAPVADWLAGPRDRPLVVDAKVTRGQPSWWLEEAFRGH
jgi:thiamine pyrophosphate-dependent acetolactate synthase large subunit-like protein